MSEVRKDRDMEQPEDDRNGGDSGGAVEASAARALREALEGKLLADSDPATEQLAGLLLSLRAAHHPRDLDENQHQAILAPIFFQPADSKTIPAPRLVSWGKAAWKGVLLVAAAAAVVVVVAHPGRSDSSSLPYASRSTQEMFSKPFGLDESGDARVERAARIESARLAELRHNRYQAWGVR